MPSGEARSIEMGDTYAKKYGFGHEEWLFNYTHLYTPSSKTEKKFKYGFVQPIEKFLLKYTEQSFDLLLYSVSPERQKFAVGIIRNAYVPGEKERLFVRKQMHESGQIGEMTQSLLALGLDPSECDLTLTNIRFDIKDVSVFDPFIELPLSSKLQKTSRYHPYNWNDGYLPTPADLKDIPYEVTNAERSEEMRRRCAIAGVVYSPEHVILQNQIYRFLCSSYGKQNVFYEQNAVDLRLVLGDEVIFYELKILPSAKKCIREALGQLLEYCHYGEPAKATKLIIIGDGAPQDHDINYLNEIRTRYQMPLYYQQWDRVNGRFFEAV